MALRCEKKFAAQAIAWFIVALLAVGSICLASLPSPVLYPELSIQSPLVVCIADSHYWKKTRSFVYEQGGKAGPSWYMIPAENHDLSACVDSVNSLLAQHPSVNKQRIYLVIIGDNKLWKRLQYLDSEIWAARMWVSGEAPQVKAPWLSGSIEDLAGAQKTILERRRWEIDVVQSHQSAYTKGKARRQAFSLGVSSIWANPRAEKGSTLEPPARMRLLSLKGIIHVLPHLEIVPFAQAGIAIPRPDEQAIQSQVRDQIDIESILNGSSDDITVDVSFALDGYITGALGMDFHYVFNDNWKISPYAGLGVSNQFILSFSGSIDTTLTIDPNDALGGSFGGFDSQSRPGLNPDDEDSPLEEQSFSMKAGLRFVAGTRLHLGPQFSADISTSWTPFQLDQGDNPPFSQFTIGLGLNMRFLKARQKSYHYLRL
jgi:hypothetical protein